MYDARMNRINSLTQKTIPWRRGQSFPAELLEVEVRSRECRQVAKDFLRLSQLTQKMAVPRVLGDLDPRPDRILLRKNVDSKEYITEIKTDGVSSEPISYLQQCTTDRTSTSATWSGTNLVSFSLTDKDRSVTVRVNDNGTLTYCEEDL